MFGRGGAWQPLECHHSPGGPDLMKGLISQEKVLSLFWDNKGGNRVVVCA